MQQRESGAINIGNGLKPEYTRTAASIMMLQILYSRDIVSVSELANLLQTNPRNIPEYKKELQCAGYLIDSVPGRYGGYHLVRQGVFPSVKLEKSEQDALIHGFEYLSKRNDFLEKEELNKAMAKISAAILRSDVRSNTLIANRFPLLMPEKELEKRYLVFSKSIVAKTSIEIEYLSLKNVVTHRLFNPYKLFMYNNAWCVLGQYADSEHIIYLKLNRVQSFTPTGKKFRIPLTYRESDYLDEYGMKQNGEWYQIKLQLFDQYAMLVKERVYGKNQTVEEQEDGSTILTCEMQNKENIKVFVLGFGEHCKVVGPKWLREEIYRSCQSILKFFNW